MPALFGLNDENGAFILAGSANPATRQLRFIGFGYGDG
ncbi:hypothetical protein ADINL_1604 [Nitrincola lacisaponensis]|uniref:Uncharacterized protein n=1 Tax=Nitrincola lacisaponensis TaxID=267850 RepID=A0A063Y6E4_9GAMM|nr:hypothetical protein ADINL_1604 [Nitrincola lacisaponensis]